jgi:hypothetical protein
MKIRDPAADAFIKRANTARYIAPGESLDAVTWHVRLRHWLIQKLAGKRAVMLNVRVSIQPLGPEFPMVGAHYNNAPEACFVRVRWQLPRGACVHVEGIEEQAP